MVARGASTNPPEPCELNLGLVPTPDEMTDQEAREFVEMLAVPRAAEPPPCPICGRGHPFETSCPLSTARRFEAAGAPEVLLRLPQPGGFEGFSSVDVVVDPHD